MKPFLIIISLFVLIQTSIIGQVEVTGTVVDQDGNILIGVNIVEKGKENGTITGIDGTFRLVVHSDSLELAIWASPLKLFLPIQK